MNCTLPCIYLDFYIDLYVTCTFIYGIIYVIALLSLTQRRETFHALSNILYKIYLVYVGILHVQQTNPISSSNEHVRIIFQT